MAESETIRTAAIAKKETGERLRMDGAGDKGRKEVGLARWEEDATDPMDGSARVIFQISQCHNRPDGADTAAHNGQFVLHHPLPIVVPSRVMGWLKSVW